MVRLSPSRKRPIRRPRTIATIESTALLSAAIIAELRLSTNWKAFVQRGELMAPLFAF